MKYLFLFAFFALRSFAVAADATIPSAMVDDGVRDWVKAYVAIENTNKVNDIVGSYWETVDYLDHGKVDTDFIRKETTATIKQWPSRRITITGEIVVKSLGDDTNWKVTYPSHVVLKDKKGTTSSMDLKNTLTVTLSGDTYAIAFQHETVTKAAEGAPAGKGDTR